MNTQAQFSFLDPAPIAPAAVSSSDQATAAAGVEAAFEVAFREELRKGPTTASAVRSRFKIPPSNAIGATVRGLARRGVIFPVEVCAATTPAAHGRLERRWALTKPEGSTA